MCKARITGEDQNINHFLDDLGSVNIKCDWRMEMYEFLLDDIIRIRDIVCTTY